MARKPKRPRLSSATRAWLQGYAAGLLQGYLLRDAEVRELERLLMRDSARARVLRGESSAAPTDAEVAAHVEDQRLLRVARKVRESRKGEPLPKKGRPSKYGHYWRSVIESFPLIKSQPQFRGMGVLTILRELMVVQLSNEKGLEPAKARTLIDSPTNKGVELQTQLETMEKQISERHGKPRSG